MATSAAHQRTRERFLALYEVAQESCATRVAARTCRHPQTVMEWLHLYNTMTPSVTLPAQKTEARVACAVLNRMTRLGMPVSQRTAWKAAMPTAPRPPADLCTKAVVVPFPLSPADARGLAADLIAAADTAEAQERGGGVDPRP